MPVIEVEGEEYDLNDDGFMQNPDEWSEEVAKVLAHTEEGKPRFLGIIAYDEFKKKDSDRIIEFNCPYQYRDMCDLRTSIEYLE